MTPLTFIVAFLIANFIVVMFVRGSTAKPVPVKIPYRPMRPQTRRKIEPIEFEWDDSVQAPEYSREERGRTKD